MAWASLYPQPSHYLAKVEPHSIRMFSRQLLNHIQCSFAKSWSNGVEENKYKVSEVT